MPQSQYPPLFHVATLLHKHQTLAGGLVGAVTLAFGPPGNKAVEAAFGIMILDVAAGLLKGVFWQAICDEMGWQGIKKRAAFTLAIAFGHAMDHFIGSGDLVRTAFACMVAGQESVSFLKNIAAAGVAVPSSITALVQALFQHAGEEAEDQLLRTARIPAPKETK